jgi:TetR/AcrR family transcriptional regulator, mexJK operon transcriptional repressor
MSHAQPVPGRTDPTPKQQDIEQAASRLFMAQGYAAVSMDAIARAAGVSKATLYAYFSSKERLFASLIGEACARSGPGSVPLADDADDLHATLTALADRTLHFILEEQSLAIYRAVIAEVVRFPEIGRAFYGYVTEASRRGLATWIERQMAAGRLAARDPALAAQQFMGLLRTNLHMRALFRIDPPPSEAEIAATVAAAVETFLRAYAPAGAPPA